MSPAWNVRKYSAAIIALDLALKVQLARSPHTGHNEGALLGLASGGRHGISTICLMATVLSVVTIAALILGSLRQEPEKNPSVPLALELMIFGAVGNLLDRLFANPRSHAVTDYLAAGPLLLNLSDVLLIAGFAWLVKTMLPAASDGLPLRSSNTRSE